MITRTLALTLRRLGSAPRLCSTQVPDAFLAADQPARAEPDTTERATIRACRLEVHQLGVVGRKDHVRVPSRALRDVHGQYWGTVRRQELVAHPVGGRAPIGWLDLASERSSRSRTWYAL